MYQNKPQIFIAFILIFLNLWLNAQINANEQTSDNFEQYKLIYAKSYATGATEAYARFCWNYNRRIISIHNTLYKRGLRTFGLHENQFTDMLLLRFNTMFPVTEVLNQAYNSTPPQVSNNPPAVHEPTEHGFNLTIADQGLFCNSGWAHAAAKSIELMQAYRTANISPAVLSAQNLIDCAGGARSCKNQLPQTAFDYLTQYMQDLYLDNEYVHHPKTEAQGMCLVNHEPSVVSNLLEYAFIENEDDEALMRYVAAGYPVVVEFNPTSFEFMHYAEGVFQNPIRESNGAHFMVVIGYGQDAQTGLNYWLLQNSFGENWGENGLIKIARSDKQPLAKNAIFPLATA